MLRFLECALLSSGHAAEMLKIVTTLGSKINHDIILKMNSASNHITSTMITNITQLARNKYILHSSTVYTTYVILSTTQFDRNR
jgi:hypothetical protein